MKKMVLGLLLSLAALAFLMSPAVAAPNPALSAADQAFLASLATVPAGAPAPELAAKRPAIGPKSLCTATANCANGGTVSCSSNTSTSSCSAVDGNCGACEPGHVTCDGVTTTCSPCANCICGDPNFCFDREADCEANCNPCSYNFTCNESTCSSHCRCIFSTCPP